MHRQTQPTNHQPIKGILVNTQIEDERHKLLLHIWIRTVIMFWISLCSMSFIACDIYFGINSDYQFTKSQTTNLNIKQWLISDGVITMVGLVMVYLFIFDVISNTGRFYNFTKCVSLLVYSMWTFIGCILFVQVMTEEPRFDSALAYVFASLLIKIGVFNIAGCLYAQF